jgi:hypothetical protein
MLIVDLAFVVLSEGSWYCERYDQGAQGPSEIYIVINSQDCDFNSEAIIHTILQSMNRDRDSIRCRMRRVAGGFSGSKNRATTMHEAGITSLTSARSYLLKPGLLTKLICNLG